MKADGYSLSKSRFIRGMQCHKSLWLYTHKPELREESEATQAVFAQGYEVGELAHMLFPKGKLIPFEGVSLEEQIALTKSALKTSKTIYEAAFFYNGVFVKVDILHKTPLGWNLYEVKSSTDVKDVYLDDVAVQYHVLTGSGIKVHKAFVIHLNNNYVRQGNLDFDQLFTKCNVTDDILGRQKDVATEIKAQQKILSRKSTPKIDIGPHCSKPYDCDFMEHCWSHIPDNSVFDLAGKGADKFELYREGVVKIEDIPLDRLKGQQRQQAEVAQSKKTIVSKSGLKKFLQKLHYPLYFLDFETFMSAVPIYDGQRPYQQIPFQYSLHRLDRKGGKLTHTEYLAMPSIDPRKELAAKLVKEIPASSCVLAYWKSFESARINELAELFPGLKNRLLAIVDNMVDLIEPFKSRHMYSWKQKGSHSIKAVLPAFVKGMSYENMEIADGGAAMEAYHRMCTVAEQSKEFADIRKSLLEYCKQDTLAMVKLLEAVENRAN